MPTIANETARRKVKQVFTVIMALAFAEADRRRLVGRYARNAAAHPR